MTDLDRYGLFALAVVILLILFISMGNMECDEDDEGYDSVSLITELPVPEPVEIDDSAPVLIQHGPATTRGDFDFDENPASYPGGDEETASPPAPEPVRGAYVLHKVRKGESYSSISKKYYGSTVHWGSLQSANPGVTPRSLKVGQVIRVPKKPDLSIRQEGSGKSVAGSESRSPIRHKVRKNDTLAGISKQYYGTTRKWRLIYDANRSKIRNPDVLKVGVSLSIPR